jgi:serine/threonine-protein kinase
MLLVLVLARVDALRRLLWHRPGYNLSTMAPPDPPPEPESAPADVSTALTSPGGAPARDVFGPDPLVGTVLAERYEIVRRIGEGGMGAVYEARHTVIGKRVAVKVLLEKFLEKPELVARLLQEARLASSIGHEHIVDVTDFGTTTDGRAFVVMEYLEGESLAELVIRDAPLARRAQPAHGPARWRGRSAPRTPRASSTAT